MSIKAAVDTAVAAALKVSALTTVATGGVWNSMAPEGSVPPYVVFNQQSEVIEQTFDRRLYSLLYQVQAVVKGYPKAASELDAICDTLLNRQPLTITGASHILTLRESGLSYAEVVGGALFYHQIGIYRITADKAG